MRNKHLRDADRDQTGITRRDFYRLGAAALVVTATPLLARSGRADSMELVTEIPANEALVTSLQYTNQSQKEGQHCSTCMLFTPGEDGKGKCQLFQEGMVSQTGWCLSWTKKP